MLGLWNCKHWHLEQDIQQAQRTSGSSMLSQCLPPPQLQILQLLGPRDGVSRLLGHALQEEAYPRCPLAMLADREQQAVLVTAVALKVGAEVEQRQGQ